MPRQMSTLAYQENYYPGRSRTTDDTGLAEIMARLERIERAIAIMAGGEGDGSTGNDSASCDCDKPKSGPIQQTTDDGNTSAVPSGFDVSGDNPDTSEGLQLQGNWLPKPPPDNSLTVKQDKSLQLGAMSGTTDQQRETRDRFARLTAETNKVIGSIGARNASFYRRKA